MGQALPGRLALACLQRHALTLHGQAGGFVVGQQRAHRLDERRGHDDVCARALVPDGIRAPDGIRVRDDIHARDGHPVPVGGHDVERVALDVEQDPAEHRQLRVLAGGEPDRVERGRQGGGGKGYADGAGTRRGGHGILPVIE
ncbi:hypothetical protein RKD31_001439 [Streptomyces sp. SAI-163]